MTDGGESLRPQEFMGEAEEILEALGSDLQAAEAEMRGGGVRIQRLNSLFRGMHSLKGLAGMFGRGDLSRLAHRLEDVLDRLRMGECTLDAGSLDLLFDAHERLEALVSGCAGEDAGLEELLGRLQAALGENKGEEAAAGVAGASDPQGPSPPVGLDAALLSSLTRFEEHRLRAALAAGVPVRLVALRLPMESFDGDLRSIIGSVGEAGEVISTLPCYQPDEAVDGLGFQLLVAATCSEEELLARVGRPARVETVRAVSDEPSLAPPAPGGGPVDPPQTSRADDDAGPAAGEAGGSASVRVDLERLDRIMNSVGELLLFRRSIADVARRLVDNPATQVLGRDLTRATRDLDKRLHELQRSVIGARMVPVSQMVGRLSRLVRKLSRRSGKEMVLESRGGQTELDKVMIDRLLNPLIHMVRNAVDHGLEDPHERRRAGKPARGRLLLTAAQRGNSVIITLSDDGRGIDAETVCRAGVKRGLLEPGTPASLELACDLIFEPGFSSSPAVDEVSGRGFGLDVARREIRALNGEVTLRTSPGVGTVLEIELPITLAIIQCMLVRAGDLDFAVPVAAIAETLRYRPERTESIATSPVVRLRGETLPLVDLRRFFRLQGGPDGPPGYVVVTRSGERPLALAVGDLMGQHEVVIKPVGRRLESIPGIAGATEVAENRAALVLDVTTLTAEVQRMSGAA